MKHGQIWCFRPTCQRSCSRERMVTDATTCTPSNKTSSSPRVEKKGAKPKISSGRMSAHLWAARPSVTSPF